MRQEFFLATNRKKCSEELQKVFLLHANCTLYNCLTLKICLAHPLNDIDIFCTHSLVVPKDICCNTLWMLTKKYLACRFFCPKIQYSMVVTQNIFVEYLPHTFSSCCQATFSSLRFIFSVCCEYLPQTYSGCCQEHLSAYYLVIAKNIFASHIL